MDDKYTALIDDYYSKMSRNFADLINSQKENPEMQAIIRDSTFIPWMVRQHQSMINGLLKEILVEDCPGKDCDPANIEKGSPKLELANQKSFSSSQPDAFAFNDGAVEAKCDGQTPPQTKPLETHSSEWTPEPKYTEKSGEKCGAETRDDQLIQSGDLYLGVVAAKIWKQSKRKAKGKKWMSNLEHSYKCQKTRSIRHA